MGSALFGVARQTVLALLFSNHERRFYQREIINAAGLGSGAIQRELQRLVHAGILLRTVEGRQTYFQANPGCPIFAELRGIVRKTFGIGRSVRHAIADLAAHIEVAFIYGSVASGTETAKSDVDLMIIGEASLLDVISALSHIQRELGREINPTVYPVAEFCRKLRSGQHFITKVMAGPKLFLLGDEQQLTGLAQIRMAQGAQDKPRRDRRLARGRGSRHGSLPHS
ncbi:MAG: nucleotidyltransferase domain-containing protein [Bryobacteraceae bacterium]